MDVFWDVVGLIGIFVLAHGLGYFTMIHRRNNEGIVGSIALAALAFYVFGIVGLMFFGVGVVHGACKWIARCDAANDALLARA